MSVLILLARDEEMTDDDFDLECERFYLAIKHSNVMGRVYPVPADELRKLELHIADHAP